MEGVYNHKAVKIRARSLLLSRFCDSNIDPVFGECGFDMKRLLSFVLGLSFLFISCTTTSKPSEQVAETSPAMTSVSVTSTSTTTSTSTPTLTLEPSATATEAPKATATPEIQDITFTNTDGVDVTMPECTGPNAAQNCMDYLSKNALWVTGDPENNFRATTSNRDVVRVGNLIKKIPGYIPIPNGYPHLWIPGDTRPYIDFFNYSLGSGTLIYFQDQQEKTKTLYVDGVTPDQLISQLDSGMISIPNPNPTTTPTP